MHATNLASMSQILWRIIETHELDPAPVFASAGIDPERWRDPDARFSVARLDAAWLAAETITGDPCLGLRAAQCWHPSQLHALGYAWLSSDSLLDALQRLVRFSRVLTADTELSLMLSGRGYRVAVEASAGRAAIVPVMDAFWAVLLSMARSSLQQEMAPVELQLRRLEPSCAADFYGLFRCPIRFGAEQDAMVLDRTLVERRLPTANRLLAETHDRIFADYQKTLSDSDTVGRVRKAMMHGLSSGELDEARVAAELHISRRTLQRRLAAAATSFTALLDETRRELALRYVGDPAVSLKEAAYLLGFSEPSNFSRAFRRWTGRSPRAYREGLQDPPRAEEG